MIFFHRQPAKPVKNQNMAEFYKVGTPAPKLVRNGPRDAQKNSLMQFQKLNILEESEHP